jgi:hypothetical protein
MNRLLDKLAHVTSPPLLVPFRHALTQAVAAPACAQETAELMTLWSVQSTGTCRCMEATKLMAQRIAESDACFLLAAAEKAFPSAGSRMVYRC